MDWLIGLSKLVVLRKVVVVVDNRYYLGQESSLANL
jgi:hypothetical protein